jgi:hypothetical protein
VVLVAGVDVDRPESVGREPHHLVVAEVDHLV